MGVCKDPVGIITGLAKAESNRMFDAGRCGGARCNRIREAHESRVGPQEFCQLPLARFAKDRQDTGCAAHLNDGRKDVARDGLPDFWRQPMRRSHLSRLLLTESSRSSHWSLWIKIVPLGGSCKNSWRGYPNITEAQGIEVEKYAPVVVSRTMASFDDRKIFLNRELSSETSR